MGRRRPAAARPPPDRDVRGDGARRAARGLRHRREPGAGRGRPDSAPSGCSTGSTTSSCRTSSSRAPRSSPTSSSRRRRRSARSRAPSPRASAACSACARRSTRRARRATTSRSSTSSRAASATTSARRAAEDVWNELRSLSPMHAGMSYARLEELGGIQWPCRGRGRPGRALPPRPALGRRRRGPRAVPAGRARPAGRPARRRLPAAAHDRAAARVVQHRRADAAATRRRSTSAARRSCSRPRTASATASPTARACASSRGAARSRRPARYDPTLRPGLAFMNLHFPDEVATNVLTIDATDPKSGTAEFKATAIRLEAVVVDLRLLAAEPTDAEREAIDAVVGAERRERQPRRARATATRRHLLLPALRAAQRRVGWVSEGALGYTSRRLDVPPADAYGVATFYALLALEERPAEVLHVCTDLSCRLAGRARCPTARTPRRASASASARRPRCARSPGRSRARSSSRRRRRRCRRRRRPEAPAPHRRGRRSRVAARAPRRSTRARVELGPERRARARRSVAAARPRRRRVPDRREVGGGRAAAGAAALPRLQRRRVGAGHVQGPRADGGATRSRSSRR